MKLKIINVSSSFQQQVALASRTLNFRQKTLIGLSEVNFQLGFFYLSFEIVVFKITFGCSNFIAFSQNFKINLKMCRSYIV